MHVDTLRKIFFAAQGNIVKSFNSKHVSQQVTLVVFMQMFRNISVF
jgi:hypothetical protein